MKIFIAILLSFLTLTAFSQAKQDTSWKIRLNRVETQINDLEKQQFEREISILKDKLAFQQTISEQSISSVSNQLDSASYNLTVFGILFAIAAIGLGVYVTYVERKIVKIGEENKELLMKNQKIKDDVEAINNLIQSDIYNLFLKIKREETIHTLDRLIKVPKDMTNVCDTLLSRELEQEDFSKLRQAYFNLGESGKDYQHQYHILFFQHFFAQALRDEKLRETISDFIPTGVLAAFENDILKSTVDFATLLVDKGVQEFQKEIRLFFNGLTNSEYKNFNPVFQTLFDNLKSRKNRFDLYTIVEAVPEQRIAKIEFGKLLENKYLVDNPSQSEQLAFEDLKELIASQQKADEEARQKEEEQKIKQAERQKQQEERRKAQEEKQKIIADKKKNEGGE